MRYLFFLVTLAVVLVCFTTIGANAAPYHVYVRRGAAMPANVTQAMKTASVEHEVQLHTGAVYLFNATSEDAVRENIEKMYDAHEEATGTTGNAHRRRTDNREQIIINRVLPARKGVASVSWGQDRIDQVSLPLNGQYVASGTGAGVTAWTVDTGVQASHPQFLDPVTGLSKASNDFTAYPSTPVGDCDGHGTHVGATIVGNTCGVAPGARLRAIKVLNCAGAGTTYTVAQGLLYIMAHLTGKDVINLSLGYNGRDSTVQAILVDLMASGAFVAAAAGNDNLNACNHFPSAQSGVASVAASTISDARASFSNFGSCVSLFAPGQNIWSAKLNDIGVMSMSGTSMASPHVTGLAALIMQNGTGMTSAQVLASIMERTSRDQLSGINGSPNYLLFIGVPGTPATPTAPPSTSPTGSPSRTPYPSVSQSKSPSRTPSSSRPPKGNSTRPRPNAAASVTAFSLAGVLVSLVALLVFS